MERLKELHAARSCLYLFETDLTHDSDIVECVLVLLSG